MLLVRCCEKFIGGEVVEILGTTLLEKGVVIWVTRDCSALLGLGLKHQAFLNHLFQNQNLQSLQENN